MAGCHKLQSKTCFEVEGAAIHVCMCKCVHNSCLSLVSVITDTVLDIWALRNENMGCNVGCFKNGHIRDSYQYCVNCFRLDSRREIYFLRKTLLMTQISEIRAKKFYLHDCGLGLAGHQLLRASPVGWSAFCGDQLRTLRVEVANSSTALVSEAHLFWSDCSFSRASRRQPEWVFSLQTIKHIGKQMKK